METPLRKFESANPLLTDREACEYLRLCPRQLYALRKRGLIPFVRIGGRTVRYRLRNLDAAVEAMAALFPEVPVEVEANICTTWAEK